VKILLALSYKVQTLPVHSAPFLFILFIFELSYYCCTGRTLWHLQKFLQYIIVEFTAPPFSFILLSPFLEEFQQVSFFHFHTCVHNFSTIFTSYTLSLYPTLSSGYQPADRTCFTFLSSIFERRHFCLYKIATQGVSLWHFHVYMYYYLNWFIPSIFLLSTLVPFLWWLDQV
jgi:hypothetical protein